jgi:D-methionine transport system ATP-binding protein
MIEIRHLNKSFDAKEKQVHACRDVSLSIDQGQIYGVIGYSGAGKSTLVRCINFLETPNSGEVEIDGFGTISAKDSVLYYTGEDGKQVKCSEKHLRKLRSSIGMIFQHFNLLDRSTVFDNVAYPLKYTGKSKKEIAQKVDNLLELVDLQDKKYSYPSELSGGQKQRVAIARALANDPKILLSDEATSALDPDATQSILALLQKLNEQLGLTIVLITHEMEVIKNLADRVAVMENGKVVEEGEVYQIFSHPQASITQNFVNASFGLPSLEKFARKEKTFIDYSDGNLVQLIFSGDCTGEDLIVETCKKFDMRMNIILADVELLKGAPLGMMVVQTKGDSEKVEGAINHLKDAGVQVREVLNERVS